GGGPGRVRVAGGVREGGTVRRAVEGGGGRLLRGSLREGVMIHAENTKVVSLITPQSVAPNATATATVSCVGFRWAEVTLHLATQTASNVDTTMTVTESDGTTYVTNADLAMTTAAPDTSSAQMYVWFLDLRKRKKNLKITYTSVG